MRLLLGFATVLALTDSWMMDLLEQFFYPALLIIFVIASLGVPIPEDIPLILAGVMIKTHPSIASWELALPVALVGIMSGDVILYYLGRRWGRNVFEHRSVSWLMTPARMEIMVDRFHRWGVWACFFGRFMMGVRAAMCITAGVTRFSFWKFFLADFAGAVLSAPFFMYLGYKFAEYLPELEKRVENAQLIIFGVLAIVIAAVVYHEVRRIRRMRRENAAMGIGTASGSATTDADASPPAPLDSATKAIVEKPAADLHMPKPRASKAIQGNV